MKRGRERDGIRIRGREQARGLKRGDGELVVVESSLCGEDGR